MLSKDFIVLVLISCLIVCPLSYYFLSSWLKNFEYRSEISLWDFISSSAAVFITLATVSYQPIKAALMKPVNRLRS